MQTDARRGLEDYGHRHLRWGWWSLLVFAAFGLMLELLHGFKIRLYLDVSSEARRLMWTLAHAHGIGLALVHIAFAYTTRAVSDDAIADIRLASRCLIGASVLLPGGFLLAGISVYAGDPGLGVVLVPVGAALALAGVFATAQAVSR